MKRVLAHSKSRELSDAELTTVSGGTTSVVRSGNPSVVESTDPGDTGGGGGALGGDATFGP